MSHKANDASALPAGAHSPTILSKGSNRQLATFLPATMFLVCLLLRISPKTVRLTCYVALKQNF